MSDNIITLKPLQPVTENLKHALLELFQAPPYGELTISETLGVLSIVQHLLIESL